jgi:hypothetical protein
MTTRALLFVSRRSVFAVWTSFRFGPGESGATRPSNEETTRRTEGGRRNTHGRNVLRGRTPATSQLHHKHRRREGYRRVVNAGVRETHPAGTTGSPARRAGGGRATRRLTATTRRRGVGVELQPPTDERPSRRPSLAQRVSPPDPRTADARRHRGRRQPPRRHRRRTSCHEHREYTPARVHESATSDGQKLTASSRTTTLRAGCAPAAPRDRVWTDSFIPLACRRCALASPTPPPAQQMMREGGADPCAGFGSHGALTAAVVARAPAICCLPADVSVHARPAPQPRNPRYQTIAPITVLQTHASRF